MSEYDLVKCYFTKDLSLIILLNIIQNMTFTVHNNIFIKINSSRKCTFSSFACSQIPSLKVLNSFQREEIK